MQKQFKTLSFRPVPFVAAALAVVLTLALTSAALANPPLLIRPPLAHLG
jgi:hypothetical protein